MIRAPSPALAVILAILGVSLHAISVQTDRESQLSLVLLVDVSASVDFRMLEWPEDLTREIESGLLDHLNPQDQFGVTAFGARAQFSGFLPDDRRVRQLAVRAVFKEA